MLKNFFKIAFRNLLKNKAFTLINICGLVIGMASAILILLWIKSEVSTDRFYAKADRIYLLYHRAKVNGQLKAFEQTPEVLAPALQQYFPEVEKTARVINVTFLVSAAEKHFNSRGAFTDSGFLSIFNLPLLSGDVVQSLNSRYNIVLTEKMAKKLFGNESALGKTVRIDSNANFKVSAVLKDLPSNSSFDFDYLLPWSFLTDLGWEDVNWTNNYAYTYILLRPGASQSDFDARVKNIVIDHSKGSAVESKSEIFSQPLKRTYLYSKDENGKLVTGRIVMVRLFSVIAAFILLIACINFMNLSTARSEKRAKEVGIRKVSGAYRSTLVAQFIGESTMISGMAFIMALILVQLVLPAFNELVGKILKIDYASPLFWLFSLAFILFTGLTAGSYPALYLSSFSPAKVLKGTFKRANALVAPRKILVILQFTFAIILIISTIIVKDQIDYVQQRDAGYNRNNLVYTFIQGDASKHYSLIKNELLSSGTAIAATRSANPITRKWGDDWGYQWQGSKEADIHTVFTELGSDADFVKTVGVKLLQGRDIDIYKYPADSASVLLNESAVKIMRLDNPVGQIIRRKGYPDQWHVVGVVKDFILESPFESVVNPMMIKGPSYFFQVMHFKLNPANTTSANLAKAEAIFKKYNPQYPFEYVFADESYARKFEEVKRTGSLSFLFAGLTILISCLGLFGLATYMAENRIKEIGVRKVLGAGVTNIAMLLSADFLRLVLIAFLIASPVAWYAMDTWLKNYTYRINIQWWVFVAAGLLSILIAIVTISYQAIRAALSNPVKSLRTE